MLPVQEPTVRTSSVPCTRTFDHITRVWGARLRQLLPARTGPCTRHSQPSNSASSIRNVHAAVREMYVIIDAVLTHERGPASLADFALAHVAALYRAAEVVDTDGRRRKQSASCYAMHNYAFV